MSRTTKPAPARRTNSANESRSVRLGFDECLGLIGFFLRHRDFIPVISEDVRLTRKPRNKFAIHRPHVNMRKVVEFETDRQAGLCERCTLTDFESDSPRHEDDPHALAIPACASEALAKLEPLNCCTKICHLLIP